MTQLRIAPALMLLAAVGAAAALLSADRLPSQAEFGRMWQSLTSPRTARAVETPGQESASAPIQNPFAVVADEPAASPAAVVAGPIVSLPIEVAPTAEVPPSPPTPEPLAKKNHFREYPNLEPVRLRRANPQLAEPSVAAATVASPAKEAPATSAVPVMVETAPSEHAAIEPSTLEPAPFVPEAIEPFAIEQVAATVETEAAAESAPAEPALAEPAPLPVELPAEQYERRGLVTVQALPAPRERFFLKKPRDRYPERRYTMPAVHQDMKAVDIVVDTPPQVTIDARYGNVEVTETNDGRAEQQNPAPASEPNFDLAVEPSVDTRPMSRGGVTLEWILPERATVGQEVTCQLLVRNTSDCVAQHVGVEAQLPSGVEPGSCEPRADFNGECLAWQFGDLAPGSTTSVRINFTPRRDGDLTPRAAVTCSHQAAATVQVVESQLGLVVEGPKESIVGQPAAYSFRVTNNGTGPAVGVALAVALDEALEAAGGKPSYNLGTIAAGETRHVQVTVVGTRQGEFSVRGQAMVGTKVKDSATHAVRVVKPTLTMSIEGPKLRFVDRKATYVIKVENPGPVAVDNVQVLETIPEGLRFAEASSGGSYNGEARQVGWFVGRLEANETAEVGVQLIAADVGDHRVTAAAAADFGVLGETETVTEVKGAPRVVIDVTEDDDPVEIDGETIYRIRLSNIGSMPARRVQFAAEAPREMVILDVNGPDRGTFKGQQIVFPPIASLEPGQSVDYDVHVRCTKSGSVRFRAFFRSEDTPNPVLEEEATRIYAD